jgi:hypothetical protein
MDNSLQSGCLNFAGDDKLYFVVDREKKGLVEIQPEGQCKAIIGFKNRKDAEELIASDPCSAKFVPLALSYEEVSRCIFQIQQVVPGLVWYCADGLLYGISFRERVVEAGKCRIDPMAALDVGQHERVPSGLTADEEETRRQLFYESDATPTSTLEVKAGRNAPCPCGSGLKYKKCCLRGRSR